MSIPADTDRRGPGGLVLDDYLAVIADIRRRFGFSAPGFGLKQIKAEPGANGTLLAVLKKVSARYGTEIYSKRHPLLTELGKGIYGEEIITSGYSGYRIRPNLIAKTLQRAIEVGLQTIVQLPAKEAKPISVPKRLKATALALRRSAERLEAAFSDADIRRYIELWDDPVSWTRLQNVPSEVRWTVESLRTVATLKVKRVRMDSPNPQVSLTMYILGWVEAATGKPNYEEMTILIQAAFCAAGKSPPKWTNRLPIEMHLKRQWRRKWVRTISS